MEAFRQKKSPLSDRYLGRFSASETPSSALEFDEGDVFWIGADVSTSSNPSSPRPMNAASSPVLSPAGSFCQIPEKIDGILAVLPAEEKRKTPGPGNPGFLQRKSSISSGSSASTSPSSARMMIPAVPKPKAEYGFSGPMGRIHQQSAPVNIPVIPSRFRKGFVEEEEEDVVSGGREEGGEMIPPHEIVARASAKASPLTTFSVLEGVGRTLKGRDLRRVRNAVWRQTGFLD